MSNSDRAACDGGTRVPRPWPGLVLLLAGAVGAATGCAKRGAGAPPNHTVTAPPTTTQSTAAPSGGTFESKSAGIRLQYPPGWTPRDSKDYALLLVPPGASVDPAAHGISLDVPTLPPHLPGMIRMSLIENGYVNDLKDKSPDVKVVEARNETIPGAEARRLRSTWHSAGRAYNEVALLMMHGGRVYILRGTGDDDNFEAIARALESVISSLTWLK